MSDGDRPEEHDEDPSNMFFGSLVPDEVQRAMKDQMKEQQMRHLEDHAWMLNFLRTADRETLVHLRKIFLTIESAAHAAHFEGLLMASIINRFQYCPTCGGDHDYHPVEGIPGFDRQMDDIIEDGLAGLRRSAEERRADRQKLLDEYNMREEVVALDGGASAYKYFCKGCGVQYVSLEDRMVKPPDGCHHCHRKSAHG